MPAISRPGSTATSGMAKRASSLAKELGPAGIRVNAILPGIVEGLRMDGVHARAEEAGDDVAGMVLFLCSSLGRNVSGQSLGICGHVESL